MKVKMILPALTEATSPFWRPIKYSLFPPLGLATLAGYLDRRRRGRDPGRARRDARPRRRAGPGGDPGLHHLGAARVSHRRPLPRARRLRRARRPARDLAARRGGAHADTIFLGPGEDTWPRFLADFRRGRAGARLSIDGPHAGGPAADPPRPDQAAPLPGAELDRRLARLPARLRLLLQGSVLRRRPVASTRRRSTPRSPRSSGCRAGISTSSTTTCSATAASRRRCSTACAAWAGSGRRPARSTRCSRRVCSSGRSTRGLRSLFVGFETLNPANLAEQRKYQNLRRDYAAAIRRLHDLGVMINGSFVFGMDGDDAIGVRAHGGVGDRAGHRDGDVPHPHAVSRAPRSTAAWRRRAGITTARLGSLRHAPRGLPAGADVGATSSSAGYHWALPRVLPLALDRCAAPRRTATRLARPAPPRVRGRLEEVRAAVGLRHPREARRMMLPVLETILSEFGRRSERSIRVGARRTWTCRP